MSSQNYRMMIKDLFMVYSQTWLCLLRDDCHFSKCYYGWLPPWLQKILKMMWGHAPCVLTSKSHV